MGCLHVILQARLAFVRRAFTANGTVDRLHLLTTPLIVVLDGGKRLGLEAATAVTEHKLARLQSLLPGRKEVSHCGLRLNMKTFFSVQIFSDDRLVSKN